MERTQPPVIGSLILLLLVGGAALMLSRAGRSDAEVCRNILNGLIEGKSSVARRIDWERLTALGKDIGAEYRGLPNDAERARYRQSFVMSFPRGFQQAHGNLSSFRNWRIKAREGNLIVVAVDYEIKHKTLLMGVPASGPKKLETLQWQQ